MQKALMAMSIIIGCTFLFTGALKLLLPKDKLGQKGVKGFEFMSAKKIKLLGIAELIGSIITLLSTFLSLPEFVVQISLLSFSLLMMAATIHHIRRKEYQNLYVSVFIFMATIFLLIYK